jgi:cyclic AMP-dependent transcription factor ATF-4
MHFEFNQPGDLLTPTINDGGVNRNPIFSSSDFFQLDENDIHLSSVPSKKNEYELAAKDNINENSDNNEQHQLQEDLFSTFDLPVLSELDAADLQIDGLQLEKYISQSSFSSFQTDIDNSLISDDSTFPWIGNECTIESQNIEDMTVPPSPSLSLDSSSSSTSKRSTKKTNLSIVDRKLRKKDQNRTAAEKYRLKKKTEQNGLMAQYLNLKNQNKELKFEYENMTFRLEQLKQLFVDILQIPTPSKELK